MNINSATYSSVLPSESIRSVSAANAKATVQNTSDMSTPSTVVSLDTMTAVDVVYTKPAPYTQRQAWA